MTDEQLQFAINLKNRIERHRGNLGKLVGYRSDTRLHEKSILDYFCNHALYDPSLRRNLAEMLDKEIEACERCIREEEEDFLKL